MAERSLVSSWGRIYVEGRLAAPAKFKAPVPDQTTVYVFEWWTSICQINSSP